MGFGFGGREGERFGGRGERRGAAGHADEDGGRLWCVDGLAHDGFGGLDHLRAFAVQDWGWLGGGGECLGRRWHWGNFA